MSIFESLRSLPHLKNDFSERESELLYSFVSAEQLVMHVLAYAEVLFRWRLLHKRIELLKAVDPFLRMPSDSYFNSDHSQLGTPFAVVCLSVPLNLSCARPVQVYPSCVLSAINRRLLVLNRLALPVAPVSECPDALYAAFPSKARCCHSRFASFSLTQ